MTCAECCVRAWFSLSIAFRYNPNSHNRGKTIEERGRLARVRVMLGPKQKTGLADAAQALFVSLFIMLFQVPPHFIPGSKHSACRFESARGGTRVWVPCRQQV